MINRWYITEHAVLRFQMRVAPSFSAAKCQRLLNSLQWEADTCFVTDLTGSAIDYYVDWLPGVTFRIRPEVKVNDNSIITNRPVLVTVVTDERFDPAKSEIVLCRYLNDTFISQRNQLHQITEGVRL